MRLDRLLRRRLRCQRRRVSALEGVSRARDGYVSDLLVSTMVVQPLMLFEVRWGLWSDNEIFCPKSNYEAIVWGEAEEKVRQGYQNFL
jgi:hypothetical protein